MQITHDDNSPVLRYVAVDPEAGWTHDIIDATLGDRELPNYFRQSMTRTTGEGNYMFFTFNGTAVYVYGSKRFNHGVYSVSLDGGSPFLQNGRAQPSEHQSVLYQQQDLDPNKEHSIVITNLPSRTQNTGPSTQKLYLDIDYVVVVSAVSGKVYTTRIDDSSPDCVYAGDWGDVPPRMPAKYYNTTGHVTGAIDSSVTCRHSFNGSSFQLLGGLYNDHGDYTVSLDGLQPEYRNGTYYTFDAQVPLYTASGLKDGPHTVTLTNVQADRYLDFDYMIVNSTIEPGSKPVVADTPKVEEKATSTGAIVGGAVGGSVATLLLVLLAWFLWRRKNKKAFHAGYMDKAPLDLAGDEIRPFRSSTTPPAEGPFSDPVQPSAITVNGPTYLHGDTSTAYTAMAPPSNTSYPPSSPENQRSPYAILSPAAASQGHTHNQNSSTIFADGPPTSEAGTFVHVNQQPPAPSPVTQSYKALAAAIPFTARRPSTLASYEDQSTTYTHSRMFVPGREVDAGPLSPRSDDESHEMGILPPDYHQATESLPGQRPPSGPGAATGEIQG